MLTQVELLLAQNFSFVYFGLFSLKVTSYSLSINPTLQQKEREQ
jgi:hypothetical protein